MAEIGDIWLHAHHMLRSARQIIGENLRPLNLSGAEGNVLLHLLTQGQEMGQERLVEQLDLSKPAVSRTLDSLEAKGYITRKRDPGDRRAHVVRLTPRARAIGPAVGQVYNHVYTLALRGVSQKELDLLIKLLARVSQNFASEQARRESDDRNAA